MGLGRTARRKIDDRATALPCHNMRCSMRAVETPGQIHSDDHVPPSFVRLKKMLHWRNQTSVVNECVDRTKLCNRFVEKGFNAYFVCNVNVNGDRFSAIRVDLFSDQLIAFFVDISDNDLRTFGGKSFRNGFANSFGGTGYNHGLVWDCFGIACHRTIGMIN